MITMTFISLSVAAIALLFVPATKKLNERDNEKRSA